MAQDIDEIGRRHGFGPEAVRAVVDALRRGGGRMAQFSHPELGGMGQWSAGGMIMIGDMFNHTLKGRVDALCNDLSGTLQAQPAASSADAPADWWPSELGRPSAGGAQNDMRYACFPDKRRLAVMQDGKTRIYDTGDYRIHGFSQQQGGSQTLTFASQQGSVGLDQFKEI